METVTGVSIAPGKRFYQQSPGVFPALPSGKFAW